MQASSPVLTKAAYSLAEFAELVSLGRSKVYQEIRAGRLRIVKAGRRSLVTAVDLMAWLNGLTTVGAPTGAQV